MYDLFVNAFLTLNELLKKIHFDLEFLCINNIVSKSNSFATPWDVDHQAPLFMGFPRQEYWHGFPFPFPGDLLNLGIKHVSPSLAGGFFATEPPGKPINNVIYKLYCMLYCSISAIIRFGINIPVTKPHFNQIVYSKFFFFFFVE